MGFCHASILILCSQNLLIISFFSTPGVWIIVTKFSPALKCRRILSIFSRPCTVLLFQLIPNLCGIYSSVCWKISVKLIFFQMADRLSQKYLLKSSSLLQWLGCYIYYMLHFPVCCIYFWTFSFLFVFFTVVCLFMYLYHTILIRETL